MLLRPERRQRIRKEDISSPSNFVHIAHIGWESRHSENESTSPSFPSVVTIGPNAVAEEVIEEVDRPAPRRSPRRPPPPPPPPIPCLPLQSPTVISTSEATVETEETTEAIPSNETESFFIVAAEPPTITVEAVQISPSSSSADAPATPIEEELETEVEDVNITPKIEISKIEENCTSDPPTPASSIHFLDQLPEASIGNAAHTADLEAICLLLEDDLKRAKMARDTLKNLITCAICMTQRKTVALQPCGHTFCSVCPARFEASTVTRRRMCPMCNQSYTNIVSFRL